MTEGVAALQSRASESLLARKDELARAITAALYEARPDMLATYGETGRAKCLQDMHYNLEHLAAAVAVGAPSLFVRYVDWLVSLLRARGIPPDDVQASLVATQAVVDARLALDERNAVGPSLRAGLAVLSPDTSA